ncbi:hypothetical protein [Crateriforma conspicua]|uniref:Uncharacterized protein n=1 Tax=Crateriforma conspicua TaxID=2527996 RepID=A0A5C5Y846_9PLAN|nr:hypothetical protein [Crateriforma conspicua]TWT70445.1 hypothetical protein Pan14r_27510 [Crateriforma conspicua]
MLRIADGTRTERDQMTGIRVARHIHSIFGLVMAGGLAVAAFSPGQSWAESPIDADIATIGSIGPGGGGHAEAVVAAKRLRNAGVELLPEILNAMDDDNPIAMNWYRGIVADVVRRADRLPVGELIAFVGDLNNRPVGRALAVELIRDADGDAAERLIAASVDDPSLPLREMAIARLSDLADQAKQRKEDKQAERLLLDALPFARQPTQLKTIVDRLEDMGVDVSLADSFCMIRKWSLVGPFNNVGGVGFDTAYGPEAEFTANGSVDLNAKHEGKNGPVTWHDVQADSDDGTVDIAKDLDKEKGAVAYLWATFNSPSAIDIQARLSCVTANKVWINGRQVMANEVYHSGSAIDQYIGDAQLQQGQNVILLKICQNEQTQSWAQDWEFQFRLTDRNGKGLKSQAPNTEGTR